VQLILIKLNPYIKMIFSDYYNKNCYKNLPADTFYDIVKMQSLNLL